MMDRNSHKSQQDRIDQYLNILEKEPALLKPAQNTLQKFEETADRMYAVTFAPVIINFVLWVLKSAEQQGIKRLYFLSRDAYPMYLAAKELLKKESLGIEIDIRYLRVSRYSLRIPEYHLLGEQCLDRIFLSGIDISMYQILNRAQLSEEEMIQVCRELQYEKDLRDILNRAEILQLKERTMDACKIGVCSLLSMVYRHSKECFDNTLGYLSQEGMLDDVRYAVVDSGWVGSIQKSLQNLLATAKPDIKVYGYYFGLYELPEDTRGCEYKAFYFMPKGSISRKTKFSNCLFEVVYSEPCGMVKYYDRSEKLYVPVLSAVESPNEGQLKNNEKVLKTFIGELIKEQAVLKEQFKQMNKETVKVVEKLFSRLMAHPSKWEASYYGGQMFSDDLADEHMRKTANELSQQEIRDLRALSKIKIMLGLSKKVIHESAWIEGTIVNGKENIAVNLWSAHIAKTLTYMRQSLRAKQ